MNSRGWRGAVVVCGLGVVSALAMPPTGLWWLLAFTLPLFLFRFDSVTMLKMAFRDGWLFGFGYFCLALHWIGYAFLVDAKTYLWMMPFAVVGLAAVMAVYWGLAALVVAVAQRYRFQAWLGFPLALAIAEWLRGHLMTGFPWAAPGLAADNMGGFVQVASVVGMPSLTLMILAASAAVGVLLQPHRPTHKLIAVLLMLLVPAGWLWGLARERSISTTFVDSVVVRIVQPNIPQEDKWRAENASQVFEGLVAQSTAPGDGERAVTHVIWPESAVSFFLAESQGARQVLRQSMNGKVLITGAIRRAQKSPDAPHFTSVLVFDHDAEVAGVYDKWRLVPGGEFLPFAWILEPLGFQQLVSLPGGFTAGQGPVSLDIPGAGRAGIVICYEAIFPDQFVDPSRRPDWIINVTNDGWFGTSTGPYQHVAQARMRAIEQGLPLVRAANTGVSVVFDGVGRAQAALPIGVRGVIDVVLPQPLPATAYAIWGDWILILMVMMMMFLLLVSRANCRNC